MLPLVGKIFHYACLFIKVHCKYSCPSLLTYVSIYIRFFETDLDPEDCVPDDEYCVVDKESGELVRLTLEEKERIFLDSLQVSSC